MRKSICLALLAAWAATGAAHAQTPTLEAIKTATDEAWKGVKSLSGEITMEFVMPFAEKPLNLTGKGDLHMLREDGKDKFRKRVSARLPEPFAMEMKLDVLYDGRKVRTITELMGQTQSQEGDPSLRQGALPPGGADLLAAMEKEMALTPLPNSEVGGQACFVVEGRAKDPEIPFSKVVFYLDQALGIQRKVEIYQQDGTVGISETIENIKLDVSPDPSMFVVQK